MDSKWEYQSLTQEFLGYNFNSFCQLQSSSNLKYKGETHVHGSHCESQKHSSL